MKKIIIALGLTLTMASCGGSIDGSDTVTSELGGQNGENPIGGENDPSDNGDDLAELGELLEGLTQGKIEISNFQTYLQGTWNIKAFSLGNSPNIQSQISFSNGGISNLDSKPFFTFEEGTLLENAQKYYDHFEVKEEFCKSQLALNANSYIPFNNSAYSFDNDDLFGSYTHEFLGVIPQISYEFINTGFNPILKITATSTYYPTCCLQNEACQDGDGYNPEPYKNIRSYTVLAANENAFVVEANGFYVVLTRE